MKLVIETYGVVGGTFQLRFRRSWDGSIYAEVGMAWGGLGQGGFGHPAKGRHTWTLEKGDLQQRGWRVGNKIHLPCHYRITVDPAVARELEVSNRL